MKKVIHCELDNTLKINSTGQWYMYKPDPFQENGKHKIIWVLEIKTKKKKQSDHPSQKTRTSINYYE